MNRKLFEYSYELKQEKKHKTSLLIINFLVVYILINLVFAFLLFPVQQTSDSMIPDFPQDSFSFVTPLYNNPKRGDVVLIDEQIIEKQNFFKKVWHNVSSFFTAQRYDSYVNHEYPSTNKQLRRIVGMPGDEIYMKDYVLYIKPQNEKHYLTEFELIDSSYNLTFIAPPSEWNNSIGVKGSFDAIKLNSDEYFLLSDNRLSCADSRIWGSLKKDKFKGRILLTYFPFSNLKIY